MIPETKSAVARVSVVIPTFGRPASLVRAIRSVLDQTMLDLEVVVVVDGYDAETLAALTGIADPRVRHVAHPEKRGAAIARNTGAGAAKGEWVAFLDDDDEWLPEKLAKQLALVGEDRAVVMTRYRVVSPFGEAIKPARPYVAPQPVDEWLFDRRSWLGGAESMLQTSALMMPRALFADLRFRDTGQHEEWELAIRATKQHGYALLTVDEPLVIFYVGRSYPWRRSIAWADEMRDVLTPRAYAGFCLTVVTQGLEDPARNAAFVALMRAAFRHGRPTARQVFAFALIWALPHSLRQRVRTVFTGRRRQPSVVKSAK